MSRSMVGLLFDCSNSESKLLIFSTFRRCLERAMGCELSVRLYAHAECGAVREEAISHFWALLQLV